MNQESRARIQSKWLAAKILLAGKSLQDTAEHLTGPHGDQTSDFEVSNQFFNVLSRIALRYGLVVYLPQHFTQHEMPIDLRIEFHPSENWAARTEALRHLEDLKSEMTKQNQNRLSEWIEKIIGVIKETENLGGGQ